NVLFFNVLFFNVFIFDSSSQGFTSSKMEDMVTSAGFLAFFDSYCARHSSLSLFASSLSSSSDPKRCMSSSSLLSVAPLPVVSSTLAGPYLPKAFFTPGRLAFSFS
uniref:Secreted protein n=1 Tax=Marmota marmota marmota TaxID=9994 RepID=A0A8C5Z6G7_MARMA